MPSLARGLLLGFPLRNTLIAIDKALIRYWVIRGAVAPCVRPARSTWSTVRNRTAPPRLRACPS